MVIMKKGLDGRMKREILDEFGQVQYIPLIDFES